MHSRTTAITLLLAACGAVLAVLGVASARPVSTGAGIALGVAAAVRGLVSRRSSIESEHPATVAVRGAEPPSASERLRGSSLEPEVVLEEWVAVARTALDVTGAHLWLLDPSTQSMRLVAGTGRSTHVDAPLSAQSSTPGAAALSGRAKTELVRRELVGDRERPVWRYAVPLVAADVVGAATIDSIADEAPDPAALERISMRVVDSLAAAMVVHVSRTETEAARALLATSNDLFRLVDRGAILELSLARAMEFSGAATGSIMLLSPEDSKLRIATSAGIPEHVARDTSVSAGEGVAGWVLATGQATVVEDLEDRGPRSRRHGVRSAAAVPIADSDGIMGVLNVGSHEFHARLSSSHLNALKALGSMTALALRNAEAVSVSRDLYLDTVRALALALETKDPYSRGATERVHELAGRLALAMGLEDAELDALRMASLLHDVGMPAAGEVASVGRQLTTVEWGMLKMHPVIAADVLAQAQALRSAVPIVYHHHERYDGSGYVLGLAGEQIPIGARVLSVADAYVAMTSTRPHRAPLTHAAAVEELRDNSGTQFDPEVVRALVELFGHPGSAGEAGLKA